MKFSVIVFDTAPTGHTLRLLSFPATLEKAFSKFVGIKSKISGLFSQVSTSTIIFQLEIILFNLFIINLVFKSNGNFRISRTNGIKIRKK